MDVIKWRLSFLDDSHGDTAGLNILSTTEMLILHKLTAPRFQTRCFRSSSRANNPRYPVAPLYPSTQSLCFILFG